MRRRPPWVKAAAIPGFLATLLFVLISILPIVQVDSRLLFALKIGGVILAANLVGYGIFKSRGPRGSAGTL